MSNAVIKQIRVLRKAAGDAAIDFQKTLRGVGRFDYDESSQSLVHDNVRIIESESEGFEFKFNRDKHQVVIVLTGFWTMKYGNTVRDLGPADVIKVPMGGAVDTLMTASNAGTKFVYMQFK